MARAASTEVSASPRQLIKPGSSESKQAKLGTWAGVPTEGWGCKLKNKMQLKTVEKAAKTLLKTLHAHLLCEVYIFTNFIVYTDETEL